MKKLLTLLGLLLLPIHALFALDAETEKIQWHLSRVEGILRKVDTSNLTAEQKENRTKMLDRLHSYTEIGKFPNNDKFPGESVPFFRGSNGNLCAVGYLMDADPEYKGFIENIVKTNNNIQLMDVQSDPTVNVWAKKYGFSILELAMIQPTYSSSDLKNLRVSGIPCSIEYPRNCTFFELIYLAPNYSFTYLDIFLSVLGILLEIVRRLIPYLVFIIALSLANSYYFHKIGKVESMKLFLKIAKYLSIFSLLGYTAIFILSYL